MCRQRVWRTRSSAYARVGTASARVTATGYCARPAWGGRIADACWPTLLVCDERTAAAGVVGSCAECQRQKKPAGTRARGRASPLSDRLGIRRGERQRLPPAAGAPHAGPSRTTFSVLLRGTPLTPQMPKNHRWSPWRAPLTAISPDGTDVARCPCYGPGARSSRRLEPLQDVESHPCTKWGRSKPTCWIH